MMEDKINSKAKKLAYEYLQTTKGGDDRDGSKMTID
jgi:hypothetical protein